MQNADQIQNQYHGRRKIVDKNDHARNIREALMWHEPENYVPRQKGPIVMERTGAKWKTETHD